MPENVNVQTLYPDEAAAVKASPATIFLHRFLIALWWIGFAGLALFVLATFLSVLRILGVDILSSRFANITPQDTLISSLTMIVGVIVFLIVVKQLRMICYTLLAGDPFVPENSKRFRIIWITVAVAEIMRITWALFLPWLGKNDDISMEMTLNINASVWFLVMVLIILAEVFREGVRLRQDVKLTV